MTELGFDKTLAEVRQHHHAANPTQNPERRDLILRTGVTHDEALAKAAANRSAIWSELNSGPDDWFGHTFLALLDVQVAALQGNGDLLRERVIALAATAVDWATALDDGHNADTAGDGT